jgi:ADP-ribose pyrophosphatase
MQPWKTRSRRVILKHNKFLSVEAHEVELPNGQVIDDWPWLITPDYVNVVAVTDTGRFLCFRQTKYAVDGSTLATIGGYIEPEESPEAAAKRELREETGCVAEIWRSLGSYAVDGNRGAGRAHLFLARQVYKVTQPSADDLEAQELVLLSRQEMEKALRAGEFKVLGWATAVALALMHLPPPPVET